MERLIKRIGDGIVFPTELVGVTLAPDNETMNTLLHRLAAYEDTGLEPEEVEELKIENRGLKANKAIMEKILEGKHNPHDTALITQQMLQIAHLRAELKELNAPRLHKLVQAENDGRLVVLPEVPEADRKLFADNLHDVFTEWADYASAGIFDMSEGECALAKAIMKALTREEAKAALAEKGEENA